MRKIFGTGAITASALALATMAPPAMAQNAECPISHDTLTEALRASVQPAGGPANGGLENHEWAAVVNRQGVVCAVTYSGQAVSDQWLGSRGIAAEKATTANAFGLDGFALSTANVYAGAQPGGYLYGLPTTSPVRTDVLHAGSPDAYGSADDPMVGQVLGGVVVFAGGLPLYRDGDLVGALGVSGDTACADHNVAWRLRDALGLGDVPAGVAPDDSDAIIYDIRPNGKSASGYGHVMCGGNEAQIAVDIGAGFTPEWKRATD